MLLSWMRCLVQSLVERRLGKKLCIFVSIILLVSCILLGYVRVLQNPSQFSPAVLRPTVQQQFQVEKMVAGELNGVSENVIVVNNLNADRVISTVNVRDSSIANDWAYSSVNARDNFTTRTTAIHGTLSVAAASLRTTYVPADYEFSKDIYFHPPFVSSPLQLPRILWESHKACSAAPFLVVLVLTSYLKNSVDERQAIRSTYGSVAKGKWWPGKPLAAPVELLFLLGKPPTRKDEKTVLAEKDEYDDLIVVDFHDSYRNLTLKVLCGLRWVINNCPQARFIMKTDDDTFVNLPLLTTFLLERGRNNSIYGLVYFSGHVNRGGRWAVDKKIFPFPRFPAYMSGTGYVLSKDSAEKILNASSRVPMIPIEDAFITGVLPQLVSVRHMTCSGFTHLKEEMANHCDFVRGTRIVGNRMPAAEKRRLWISLTIDDQTLCS